MRGAGQKADHHASAGLVTREMVEVRQATEADIPRILELYRQLAITSSPAEEKQDPSPESFKESFGRIQAQAGHELLVAEEDGQVTGTLVLLIVPNLSHNGLPWACVENMVVEEGRRRTGTGRTLIQYALERAHDEGCYKVQLMSTNSRKDAHAFYEAIGFKASAKGFRLYL